MFLALIILSICTTLDNTPQHNICPTVRYKFRMKQCIELEYDVGHDTFIIEIDEAYIGRYKHVPGYFMARIGFDAYRNVVKSSLGIWNEFLNEVIENENEMVKNNVSRCNLVSKGKDGMWYGKMKDRCNKIMRSNSNRCDGESMSERGKIMKGNSNVNRCDGESMSERGKIMRGNSNVNRCDGESMSDNQEERTDNGEEIIHKIVRDNIMKNKTKMIEQESNQKTTKKLRHDGMLSAEKEIKRFHTEKTTQPHDKMEKLSAIVETRPNVESRQNWEIGNVKTGKQNWRNKRERRLKARQQLEKTLELRQEVQRARDTKTCDDQRIRNMKTLDRKMKEHTKELRRKIRKWGELEKGIMFELEEKMNKAENEMILKEKAVMNEEMLKLREEVCIWWCEEKEQLQDEIDRKLKLEIQKLRNEFEEKIEDSRINTELLEQRNERNRTIFEKKGEIGKASKREQKLNKEMIKKSDEKESEVARTLVKKQKLGKEMMSKVLVNGDEITNVSKKEQKLGKEMMSKVLVNGDVITSVSKKEQRLGKEMIEKTLFEETRIMSEEQRLTKEMIEKAIVEEIIKATRQRLVYEEKMIENKIKEREETMQAINDKLMRERIKQEEEKLRSEVVSRLEREEKQRISLMTEQKNARIAVNEQEIQVMRKKMNDDLLVEERRLKADMYKRLKREEDELREEMRIRLEKEENVAGNGIADTKRESVQIDKFRKNNEKEENVVEENIEYAEIDNKVKETLVVNQKEEQNTPENANSVNVQEVQLIIEDNMAIRKALEGKYLNMEIERLKIKMEKELELEIEMLWNEKKKKLMQEAHELRMEMKQTLKGEEQKLLKESKMSTEKEQNLKKIKEKHDVYNR